MNISTACSALDLDERSSGSLARWRRGARATVVMGLLTSASIVAAGSPVAANAGPSAVAEMPASTLDDLTAEGELPDVEPAKIGDPISEAELADIATIAAQREMSLAEAVAAFAWHDDFSATVQRVRTSKPGALAHAAITGPRSAEVWFTENVPEMASGSINAFRSFFPAVSVTIRTDYGLSEQEANNALVAVHTAVLAHAGDAESTFDYEKRQISVQVPEGGRVPLSDLKAIAEAATTSGVSDADINIVVTTVSGPIGGEDSGSYHYGGESLSTCTSGFTAVSSTGARRGTTAGHCGNTQSDDGDSLTFYDDYNALWGDYQLHYGPDWESDDFYSGNSSTLEVNRRDLSSSGIPVDGQSLCKNGRTTYKTCDTVRDNSVCSGANCYMVQMHSRLASGGDSGGPVFWSNTAYATHKGYMTTGPWYNRQKRDIASQADSLHEAFSGYNWATS